MDYSIEIVDIFKKEVEDGITAIFKEGFNLQGLPADISLFDSSISGTSGKSFVVAAIENGVIIGCNGFVATDFYIKGKNYACYQSCWSATHPKHQGKKVFANLVNYAKEYLKEKGAGFIFGVPNDTSHPIFIKKLGFNETPSLIVRIPNIPLIKNLFFNKKASSKVSELADSSLMVKEDQVIAIKKKISKESIEIVRVNNSYGWGKIRKAKKFGITFSYFYMGGIYLEQPSDYIKIIKKIFKTVRVSYVQIVSEESNSSNLMIRKWKKAKMNGFIYYDLNAGHFQNINMQWGIVDVF